MTGSRGGHAEEVAFRLCLCSEVSVGPEADWMPRQRARGGGVGEGAGKWKWELAVPALSLPVCPSLPHFLCGMKGLLGVTHQCQPSPLLPCRMRARRCRGPGRCLERASRRLPHPPLRLWGEASPRPTPAANDPETIPPPSPPRRRQTSSSASCPLLPAPAPCALEAFLPG